MGGECGKELNKVIEVTEEEARDVPLGVSEWPAKP
jgi:hypothetical protein